MHQGAPLPGRRSNLGRPPSRRPLLLAVAFGAMGVVAAQESGAPLEPALAACLDRIESAFQQEDGEALRSLLPADSKVLIALPSFGRSRSWYASDQVVMLLGRIFAEIEVIDFRVDRGRGSLSGTNVYFVPASWSTRGRTAGVKRCRLQLMLLRNGSNGAYQLREIKEVS